LLNTVRETLLWLKSFLEVLFRGDGLTLKVNELQGEVSHNPHEGWEVLSILFGVNIFLGDALRLKLDVLSKVDD
jgi:hypothetical protein